jgi:Leucine-rich repeat (LRR) protein
MKETDKRRLLSPKNCCLASIIFLAGIVVLLIFFAPKIGKQNIAASIAQVKATGKIYLYDPEVIDYLLQDAECRDKLTEVDFMGDFVSDISDKRFHSLKQFPHLKIIRLEYLGNVDGFLDGIQGMMSLEELSFHRSGVSEKGMHCITGFPNLKRLDFDDHTDLALLDALKGHTGIECLGLYEYKTSNDRLAFIKSFPNLRSLSLEVDLNDYVLDLHGLPKLEELYLGDSMATNEAMANLEEMKNLTKLDCEGHNITDAGLKYLKKMVALRKLDIRFTNVTEKGVKDLQQALPNCTIKWRPPTTGKP